MTNTEQALIDTVGFDFNTALKKAIESEYALQGIVNPVYHLDGQRYIKLYPFAKSDGVDMEAQHSVHIPTAEVLLDPRFWIALGKAEGWNATAEIKYYRFDGQLISYRDDVQLSELHMHRFIDKLNLQVANEQV